MRWLGVPGKLLGGLLLIALVALALASWPTAFLDRGASGEVRVSIFPLALTLFDPFVWTAVRNSLVVAGLVAAGSLVLGVGLATAGSDQLRFRGRSVLWALALIPLAAGPLLLAPGIGLALGDQRSWDWLAARSIAGYSFEDLVRWSALIWVGLTWGAPIVALASSSAIRKREPAWGEAARAAGAGRWQIWREIHWPILRPAAARASAAVFTLALVEPAGPLVLGLRRTLALLILDTATRLDQPTRVAALALLATGFAAVGRTLIGWWGGALIENPATIVLAPIKRSSFRRATLCRLVLVVWVIFAVGPVGFLLLKAYQVLQGSSDAVRLALADPELRAWLANSATTAGFALAIDLLILSSLVVGRPLSRNRGVTIALGLLQGIPPLALGVGAFALPWLMGALADTIGGLPGGWVREVALELDPARSPGFLLILVVAAGKWPLLARLSALGRAGIRPELVDASRSIGIPDRRAHLAGESSWLGFIPIRALILVFALASTNLAPALLLTPFSERRTVGPAILGSIVREGTLDPRIACAVIAVLAWKLCAFALASKSRVGSLGDWYRG